MTAVMVVCVASLLSFAPEAFSQTASPQDEPTKTVDGLLKCVTELQQLSHAIEAYLADQEALRKMSPNKFARSLRPMLPIAGCDTSTVERILTKNPFFLAISKSPAAYELSNRI